MIMNISNRDNVILISIKGTVDQNDCSRLSRQAKYISDADKPVILDIRQVRHIHFRFVSILEQIRIDLKMKSHSMKIICKDPYIISIFNLVHYQFYYDITPDMLSAKHALSGKIFV